MTGLLEPTFGNIFFDEQDSRDHLIEYKRRLGYVPEEPHSHPYLTGREYLELVGQLRSMPANHWNGKSMIYCSSSLLPASARMQPGRVASWLSKLLDRAIIRRPLEHAAFYFIGKPSSE